jgi:hypothetical protein
MDMVQRLSGNWLGKEYTIYENCVVAITTHHCRIFVSFRPKLPQMISLHPATSSYRQARKASHLRHVQF